MSAVCTQKVIAVIAVLALLPLFAQSYPRRCNKKLFIRNHVDGIIPETRTKLNCERGQIKWTKAKHSHHLTFALNNRDLVLCLTILRSGARIYRPKGTSKQLIAGVNDTGFIGCFKSECGHVPLLFEVDENFNKYKNLLYEYSGYEDIKCPACTETCQTDCLCRAPFSFHGKLKSITFRKNIYIYYFQVAEFIKYNGVFVDPLLARKESQCTNNTASLNSTQTVLSNSLISNEIPMNGTVRVYAKCPLRRDKTYHVSAYTHITKNGRTRLILCCMDVDERFTHSHLTNLIYTEQCCKHK